MASVPQVVLCWEIKIQRVGFSCIKQWSCRLHWTDHPSANSSLLNPQENPTWPQKHKKRLQALFRAGVYFVHSSLPYKHSSATCWALWKRIPSLSRYEAHSEVFKTHLVFWDDYKPMKTLLRIENQEIFTVTFAVQKRNSDLAHFCCNKGGTCCCWGCHIVPAVLQWICGNINSKNTNIDESAGQLKWLTC